MVTGNALTTSAQRGEALHLHAGPLPPGIVDHVDGLGIAAIAVVARGVASVVVTELLWRRRGRGGVPRPRVIVDVRRLSVSLVSPAYGASLEPPGAPEPRGPPLLFNNCYSWGALGQTSGPLGLSSSQVVVFVVGRSSSPSSVRRLSSVVTRRRQWRGDQVQGGNSTVWGVLLPLER